MQIADRALCQTRLRLVFPDPLPGILSGPLAAAAVFVFLYVGAVESRRRIRPSMVLWMCDEAARRRGDEERTAWYVAALRGKRALAALLSTWGVTHDPWYADNTREPLRDEIFRAWLSYGAVERDETVATTSAKPQWSVTSDFASLFDPALSDDEAQSLVADWQEDHLGTVARTRIAVGRRLATAAGDVVVSLPDGTSRRLAAGGSSAIVKGVVEELARRLLGQPAVLFLSESREHVHVGDEALLRRLGIEVHAGRLLPDALLFDAATSTFWFVEAVFTDGPIDEPRRAALEAWAVDQGIPPEACWYVTAFASRTAPAFKRLAARLARGTAVWFLDEPDLLVRLESLS